MVAKISFCQNFQKGNSHQMKAFQFSLNVFTEFAEYNSVTKIIFFFQKIAVLEPTISCVRDRDSTTVPWTQLTEKTVKLILIHASVHSLNSLNSVNSVPFRENPNIIVA